MSTRYKEDMKELFGKLSKDFHDTISNKQLLRLATEKFLNSLIDELTLGVIFDIHRKVKTGAFDLDGDEDGIEIEKGVDIEIFSQYNIKKTQDCVCPYCNRAVAATRFATHLEKCMVEGKSRQKNAARKVAFNNNIKEQENSYRDSGVSDDEDDADWSPGDKRRKKKKERNGKKRSKGTPKKNDYMDSLNVDVEAEDQDLSNLRDLLQNHSNSSSPADSTCSNRSGSTGRKKDKSKSKKSRRDRSSPCSSTSSLD